MSESNNISLVRVKPEDRTRLWNLFQKFLYEMTNYYDNDFDDEGNLNYGYFDSYFNNDASRSAYFIYQNQTIVGFVMLNRYSHLNERIDRAIAEFTIFPRYRHRCLAWQALKELFKQFKGAWEVKYHDKNAGAKALWTKVERTYNGKTTALNEFERVVSFAVK